MRRKRIPWLAMLVAVVVLGFSACGGSGSGTASPAPASPTGTVEGNAK